MPTCAKCQTPYTEGQRFCKGCGGNLLQPVATYCPGCGTQLTDQAFCHECGQRLDVAPAPKPAPVPEPAPAPAPAPPRVNKPSPLPPPRQRSGFIDKVAKGSPIHILTLVGGCLVVLAISLVGISKLSDRSGSVSLDHNSHAKAPAASSGQAKPAAGAVDPELLGPPFFSKATKVAELAQTAAQTPAPPAAGVPEQPLTFREEMEEVLLTMRKGHEDKKIDVFMSCFATSFPDLKKKRDDTLRNWVIYDYSHIIFNIDNVEEVGPNNIIALVTWEVQAQNRSTRKINISSQQYKVLFIKEQGRCVINSLEKEVKEQG
jgi:hypothetical protein